MILPVDTSTKWYHNYVTESDVVCFLGPGRVDFDNRDKGGNQPNFATMIVVWGDVGEDLLEFLEEKGIVYEHGQLYESQKQHSVSDF